MKWIDINTQKPPIGDYENISESVFVTDGDLIGTGHYNYESEKWTYSLIGRCEQDDNEITHWIPLFKLPSENVCYVEIDLDDLELIANKLPYSDDESVGYDSWKSDEMERFCNAVYLENNARVPTTTILTN